MLQLIEYTYKERVKSKFWYPTKYATFWKIEHTLGLAKLHQSHSKMPSWSGQLIDTLEQLISI